MISRIKLLAACDFASKVIGKSSLPILENVHLKGDGERIMVTGYNGDLYARMEIEGDLVIDCCAPAKRLSKLLANFTGDQIEITESSISGPQRSPLQTLPGADFPAIPECEGERFPVPGEAISKVIMAASIDTQRYTINSVYLDASGFAVGTDGRRCHAVAIDPLTANVNIPSDVAKLLAGQTGVMRTAGGRFSAVGDGWEMGGKLIEGQYVSWKAAFPKEGEGVPVSADLLAGIQIALACIGADEAGVPWIDIYPGRITGPEYESDPFETGIKIPIRLSPGYLLEAMKAAGTGATIQGGGNEPVVIRNGNFKAVVLPMKLKP